MLLLEQLYPAFACSSVPEAVVLLRAVGSFVVHEQHLLFEAVYARPHNILLIRLFYLPHNLLVSLEASEFGLGLSPEFREVEFYLSALIIECSEEDTVEGYAENSRSAAADVEYAVLELFACDTALHAA